MKELPIEVRFGTDLMFTEHEQLRAYRLLRIDLGLERPGKSQRQGGFSAVWRTTYADCDGYDRFMVRAEEIRQSCRIIEQSLDLMKKIAPGSPDDAVSIVDPRIVLPPKDKVYTTIEGTIAHFKLIMEGIDVPPGEVYGYTEAGNGELGFLLVSRGGGNPWRVRVRGPCFFSLQAAHDMVRGGMLADIIPTFGSINMIGGECDR